MCSSLMKCIISARVKSAIEFNSLPRVKRGQLPELFGKKSHPRWVAFCNTLFVKKLGIGFAIRGGRVNFARPLSAFHISA
jgi:hypothetical protein